MIAKIFMFGEANPLVYLCFLITPFVHMKSRKMIELSHVTGSDDDIAYLYRQIKGRKHSISHKQVPTYEEHAQFVKAHPYRNWFIVKDGPNHLGSVYIQFDNSLGLNLIDGISIDQLKQIIDMVQTLLSPLPAIPSIRFGGYFCNISVSNVSLQNMLLSLGFEEKQRTYVLNNNLVNERDV